MSSRGGTSFNQQLYEEAAAWLIEFRSGDIDAQGRADFSRWLRLSPEHMRAYLELAAIWNEGSALDRARHMPGLALLEQCQPQTKVIPLVAPHAERSHARQDAHATRRTPRRFPMTVRNLTGFAAAASLVGVGVCLWYWHAMHNVYATGVGEQRLITLSDGSAIELNAESKIRVRYYGQKREVELLRGEALFSVTHDASRPFLVRTADTLVRDIGTRFDVYSKPAGTMITVIQGTVAVLPMLARTAEPAGSGGRDAAPDSSHESASAAIRGEYGRQSSVGGARLAQLGLSAHEVLLTAGEQAVVEHRAAVKQSDPDIAAATAWSQGRIIFHGTPLKDVAAEFNRYNSRQLVIRDAELLKFKVSGIFSSTDPMSLVRFLESRPDMNVTETSNEIIISSRRASAAAGPKEP